MLCRGGGEGEGRKIGANVRLRLMSGCPPPPCFFTPLIPSSIEQGGHNRAQDTEEACKYRSLPSPPQMRSSLRSPDKIRAGLTRGGFRVTFSENDSLDSSLEKDIIGKPNTYYLNQDISSTKRLHLSDTNKTNPYKSHRDTSLDSYNHLYLSSTPQNKDFKSLQKDKRSTNLRDSSVSLANEMETTPHSTSSDLLTQHTEMDNSTRSLLKLSSVGLYLSGPNTCDCSGEP
uniref:Uncharacterized protein n=1 Tax=Chelonoidis abingdonii TaxID=106734 RepID=A0A8C0G928_CHEAB